MKWHWNTQAHIFILFPVISSYSNPVSKQNKYNPVYTFPVLRCSYWAAVLLCRVMPTHDHLCVSSCLKRPHLPVCSFFFMDEILGQSQNFQETRLGFLCHYHRTFLFHVAFCRPLRFSSPLIWVMILSNTFQHKNHFPQSATQSQLAFM